MPARPRATTPLQPRPLTDVEVEVRDVGWTRDGNCFPTEDRLGALRNKKCPREVLGGVIARGRPVEAHRLGDAYTHWMATTEYRIAWGHPNLDFARVEKVLEDAVTAEDIPTGMLLSRRLTTAMIRRLLDLPGPGQDFTDLADGLVWHPNFPPDRFKDYLALSWNRHCIARHPNCPPDLQLTLAMDSNLRVRIALAEHPKLTDAARAILMRDKAANVTAALVRYGNMPAENLPGLLTHKSSLVRRYAASRIEDPALLSELAMDSNRLVRKRVAKNPVCPDEAKVAVVLMEGTR